MTDGNKGGTRMRLIDADALRGPLMAFDSKVLDIVDNAPTIDPVKHGRWVYAGYSSIELVYECSECGEIEFGDALDDYCPNCGARMDGGTEDVDR